MRFWIFLTCILSSCTLHTHTDPRKSNREKKIIMTDSIPKHYPETYQPVDFVIPLKEIDAEQKEQELTKLRNHQLISEQEFDEKIHSFLNREAIIDMHKIMKTDIKTTKVGILIKPEKSILNPIKTKMHDRPYCR